MLIAALSRLSPRPIHNIAPFVRRLPLRVVPRSLYSSSSNNNTIDVKNNTIDVKNNTIDVKNNTTRIAIVGAGPSGLYAADVILGAFSTRGSEMNSVTIDLVERLATPFGLVRYGVAPDHPEVKQAEQRFTRVLSNTAVRFLGNVTVGKDLSLVELQQRYHAVILASGAESDRRLALPVLDAKLADIPSSSSSSSSSSSAHPLFPAVMAAREWVAFVNGHPDYVDLNGAFPSLSMRNHANRQQIDRIHQRLAHWKSIRSVAVVGIGNVALDVARILARPSQDLQPTDISSEALLWLKESNVESIHLIGRRGPLQAAYTIAELRELASLPTVRLIVDPKDLILDPQSEALMLKDRPKRRQYELLQSLAAQKDQFLNDNRADMKNVYLRFYVNPVGVSCQGSELSGMRLEKMRLEGDAANPTAVGTGDFEDLSCEMIVQSVGYKCAPISGVSFDARKGIIANRAGRVHPSVESEAAGMPPNVYVCGWAKRGPSGIIGTNRWDAQETVRAVVQDLDSGVLHRTDNPLLQDDIQTLLQQRNVRVVTYADWLKIDAFEVSKGAAAGKIREKILKHQEYMAVVDGSFSDEKKQ